MDQNIIQELKEIKRFVILNFIGLQFLRDNLSEPLTLRDQSVADFADKIEDYFKQLDQKSRALVQHFPHLM